jgi:hypothetical protein
MEMELIGFDDPDRFFQIFGMVSLLHLLDQITPSWPMILSELAW